MISAKFLWGNVLLGGKLQIGAKNSNFEISESTLYMKSVSMPLRELHPWPPPRALPLDPWVHFGPPPPKKTPGIAPVFLCPNFHLPSLPGFPSLPPTLDYGFIGGDIAVFGYQLLTKWEQCDGSDSLVF